MSLEVEVWRAGGASLEEPPLRCGSSCVGRVVVDQGRGVLETPLPFSAVGHNLTLNLDCCSAKEWSGWVGFRI